MTLDEVIRLIEARIEVDEEVINECDLNNYHEKDRAQSYERYAEWNRQIVKWLKQLQEVQRIVKEYFYTPTKVMDCSDAFNMVREVVGGGK